MNIQAFTNQATYMLEASQGYLSEIEMPSLLTISKFALSILIGIAATTLTFRSADASGPYIHREPCKVSMHDAPRKMLKNAMKAIQEHRKKDPVSYASVDQAIVPLKSMSTVKSKPLTFICTAAEAQGPRERMEDAHFYQETDTGIFTALLDGHGGSAVALKTSEFFQEHFPKMLDQNMGIVHRTFEQLIDFTHSEIAKVSEWRKTGTTVVMCYVCKKTHQIYTAKLGDSEANIYRSIDNQMKSIPLSCIRDWTHPKDANRAATALQNPTIATTWPLQSDPKSVRFPHHLGINVSRAIGDLSLTEIEGRPGVNHKPKITCNQLKSGDILVLACDGLKDYVDEYDIITLISENKSDQAQILVDYALNERDSQDNVSVMVIEVE